VPFDDTVADELLVVAAMLPLSTVHGPFDELDCASMKYVALASAATHDTGTVVLPAEGGVAVTEVGALGAGVAPRPLIVTALLAV